MEPELTPDTRMIIPAQVMSRLVGDETVVLDLSSGIYFGLDGVGKRIWETIADGKNLEETVTVITAEFEVDEKRAQEDIIAFAKELIERGLLEAA